MIRSHLPTWEFRGSPRACGEQYGASQAETIDAFLHMEVAPNPRRLRYARRCWEILSRWEQPVAEFIRGMARGSGLSLAEITLLLLHEEIGHEKNCTAVGATGPATRDGSAIIGQNWDWHSRLYAWPSLLRLRSDARPATITYTFPGPWTAAGINEHGLSLLWTSSGFKPKVPPQVGVPTYALTAGILGCRTGRDAIALVRQTPNAGCFIFFLADAGGELWVLEGVPGQIDVLPCRDTIARANHYESAAIAGAAHQEQPRTSRHWTSRARADRAARLLEQHRGRIDGPVVESILRDHHPRLGLCICQHPVADSRCMTLDSFYVLPAKKEFWIARGHPCRHRYERYPVRA